VETARLAIEDGLAWVFDIDLDRFFDRVQHDALMARVARRVDDRRVLFGHQAGTLLIAQAATDATTVPGSDPALVGSSSRGRVIEIEATASLQFIDEGDNRLDSIEVTPGESIVFRVHKVSRSAGWLPLRSGRCR
jgi:hypothetical protein